MSANNFLAVVMEGRGKWVGYHCCASHSYPFTDCYACIGREAFETTTELKALHKAQEIGGETYLEYGYTFVGNHWLTKGEMLTRCPCEIKRFIEEVK